MCGDHFFTEGKAKNCNHDYSIIPKNPIKASGMKVVEEGWEKEFIESGAELEHQRWAKWQKWLHRNLTYYEIENDDRKILTSVMQLDDTPWAHRIAPHNDTLALIKQAPNSYELRDLERLPLRTRPKLLKSNDKRVLENMQERRYYIKDNKVSASNLEIVSYRKTYHK